MPLLGKGAVPVTLVPMKLPSTTVSETPPSRQTPWSTLPEITFRAPGVVPPIVLRLAEL